MDKRGMIVIFGASANGIKAKRALREFNIEIDYFIDNDPQKYGGGDIEGIRVISAETLRKLTEKYQVKVIVSVSGSHEMEIRDQLKTYDIEYYAIPQWMIMSAFLTKGITKEDWLRIEKLKSIVHDHHSIAVINTLLEVRKKQNFSQIEKIYSDPKTHYMETDFLKLNTYENIVDAGAFDGDSAIEFLKKMQNVKSIFSFEPDLENFQKLSKRISTANLSRKIIAVNKGLGAENKIVRFASGYEVGSYIDENGQDNCEIIRLDTFFKISEKVDFIKMDIEGFEKEALEGARETIKRDRPSLAICLYHKPADLWEIPLMIHEMVPEYKLYIRHYSKGLTETVLYATI